MALTKCKECGHEISKTAKACPNCGAVVKRTSLFTKIVAGFIGVVVLLTIIGTCEGDRAEKERAQQAAEAARVEREAAEKRAAEEAARLAAMSPEERAAEEKRLAEEAAQQRKEAEERRAKAEQERLRREGLAWNYNSEKDELTGKVAKYAIVRSTNTFEFDFPYHGTQRARLTLRKHPKFGNDVILQIQQGQFACGVGDCVVQVRFDEGKVQSFAVSEPSDGSTETLFIRNYGRFVQQLRKAKETRISATVYQEGNPTFVFNVSGLEWD